MLKDISHLYQYVVECLQENFMDSSVMKPVHSCPFLTLNLLTHLAGSLIKGLAGNSMVNWFDE